MQAKVKSNMLLFSMEIGKYPYRYRLYFAEQDASGLSNPKIHCFRVKSRKVFSHLSLGGLYTLTYKKFVIRSFELEASNTLTNEEYFHLLELRDLKFMDEKTMRSIHMFSSSYSVDSYYYNFENAKKIYEYRPSFIQRLTVLGAKLVSYFASFVIPAALYFLFLYALIALTQRSQPTAFRALSFPIAALITLPFIVWLMYTIFLFGEIVLLNISFMRDSMLRLYFLRWAGMRKSCYIEKPQKHAIFKFGLISALLLVIGLVIIFIP